MIEKAPEKISDRVSNAFAIYAVMTTAAELLLREAERQMAKEKIALKRERKKLFSDLQTAINRTKYLCERFTEECCVTGFESFDALLNDSNNIAALVMRFYNATYGNADNCDEIRNFVKGLQVSEMFTEEQIKQFESRL
nr:MAG TPA: hypothetical protein [Caudoviricetes sp.]